MSTTVDQRVVEMRFDNQQFEAGIKTSMESLNKLKENLNFEGCVKGIDEFGNTVNKMDFSNVNNGIDQIRVKISALDVVAMTVISRITNSLMDGINKVGQATIGQIISGGKRRALNIANAKFQISGLKHEWSELEDQINFAVSGTAYGLDAAATAASQLLASNVALGNVIRTSVDQETQEVKQLDSMAVALRAISGVAAMTNSEYDEIARVFTTVAGNGRLMTMQLRQLSIRGLNASAVLAEQLGKTEQQINDMVSKGQIDFETFAGAMYDAFGEHAVKANETFTGAMSNVKAALSKIGAIFAGPIYDGMIKPLNALRETLNNVRKIITPLGELFELFAKNASIHVTAFFEKIRDSLVKDGEVVSEFGRWFTYAEGSVGGLNDVITIINNSLNGVLDVIKVIWRAYKTVFPPKTAEQMKEVSGALADLTTRLRPNEEALQDIGQIALAVFSVIRIAVEIIKSIIKALRPVIVMLKDALDFSVGILAVVSDLVAELANFITNSEVIQVVLGAIGDILNALELVIYNLTVGIKNFIKSTGITKFLNLILDAIKGVLTVIVALTKSVIYVLSVVLVKTLKVVEIAAKAFTKVLYEVAGAIEAITDRTKELTSQGLTPIVAFFQAILEKAREGVTAINDTLKTIFESIKNSAIGKILTDITNKIKELFGTTEDGVSSLNLKDKMQTFIDKLKEVGDAIRKFVTETVPWGKIFGYLYAAIFAAMSLAVVQLITNLSTLTLSLSKLAGTISEVLKVNMLRQRKQTSLIMQMAYAVTMLTVDIALLAKVAEGENLEKATNQVLKLISAVAGIMVLTLVIQKFQKVLGKDEHIVDFSYTIRNIATGVIMLSAALFMLNGVEAEGLGTKVNSILKLTAILVGAVIAISRLGRVIIKEGESARITISAFQIMALGYALSKMAEAFQLLTNEENLQDATANMQNFTQLIFSIALLTLASRAINVGGIIGIYILLKLIGGMIPEISELADAPFSQFTDNMKEFTKLMWAMLGVTAAIGVLGSVFGDKIEGFGKALVGFSIATAVLVAAVTALAKASEMIDPETLDKSKWTVVILSITLAVSAFITTVRTIKAVSFEAKKAANMIGKNIEKSSQTITSGITKGVIGFAVAVSLLAATVSMVSNATKDWAGEDWLRGVIPVVGLMIALAVSMRIASVQAKGINVSAMLFLVIGLTEVIGAVMIFQNFPLFDLMKGVASVSAILLATAELAKQISKVSNDNVKGMNALTFFLVAVGGLLYLMTTEMDDVGKAVTATGALAAVLVLSTHLVKQVSNMKADKGTVGTILALAAVVAAIGGSMALMTIFGKDSTSSLTAAAGMIAVMLALGHLLKVISGASGLGNEKTAKDKRKTILTMAALVGAIGAVVTALTLVGANNPSAALAAAGGLSLVLFVLAEVMQKLNKLTKEGDFSKTKQALIYMAGVLLVTGGVIGALTYINVLMGTTDAMVKTCMAVSSVLAATAGMLYVANKIKIKKDTVINTIAMIATACGSILIIGKVLQLLSAYDWRSMLGAAIAIDAVLIAVTGMIFAMSLMKIKNKEATSMLIAMGASVILLIGIAGALNLLLSSTNWNQMQSALSAIAVVFIELTGLLFVLKNIKFKWGELAKIGAELIMMISTIVAIGGACQFLSTINWDAVKQGLSSFVTITAVLAGLLVVANMFGRGGIAVMAALAITIIVIAGSIVAVCDSLAKLTVSLTDTSTKFAQLKELLEYISTLDIESFGVNLVRLEQMLSNLTLGIANSSESLQNAASVFAEGKNRMSNEYAEFSHAVEKRLIDLEAMMTKRGIELKGQSESIGTNILFGITNGMKNNTAREEMHAGAEELGKEILVSIKDFLGIHSPSLETNRQVGVPFVQGITRGIQDPTARQQLFNAENDLASEAVDTTAETMAEGGATAGVAELDSMNQTIEANADTVIDTNESLGEAASSELGNTVAEGGANAGVAQVTGFFAAVEELAPVVIAGLVEIGKEFAGGFAEGIGYGLESAGYGVKSAYESIMGEVYSGVGSFIGSDDLLETATMMQNMADQSWSEALAAAYASDEAWVDMWNEIKDTAIETAGNIDWDSVAANFGGMVGDINFFDEASMEETMDEMEKKISDALGDVGGAGGAGAVDKFADSMNKLTETIENQIDAWKEFDRTVDVTSEELIHNLQSQISGVNEWSNKLLILAQRGISKGLLEELANMGPQGFKYAEAFIQMTGDELEKVNELWVEKGTLSTTSTLAIQAAYALAGDEASKAYVEGLGVNLEMIQESAKKLGDSLAIEVAPEAIRAIDAYKDSFKSLYDQIEGSIKIFDKFNTDTELTSEEILENMKSQIEGITEWSENLRELGRRGISEGLLEELSSLGPDGYDKVKAFVEMSDSQLQEANDLYAQSLELPSDATANILSGYASAGNESAKAFIEALGASVEDVDAIGTYILEGLKMGLFDTEAAASLATTANNVGYSIIQELMKATDSHSPSRKAAEVGVYVDQGLGEGLESASMIPANACKNMAGFMMDGLVIGVMNGRSRVIESIVNVAVSAVSAAESALGIESPSKVFEGIGRFTDLGFAEGINKNAKVVSESTEDMGMIAINSMRDAIKHANDIISGNIDNTITITPVLDLTNVRAGVNKINGMMTSPSMSANAKTDEDPNSLGKNQNGSMTFIQNNYSPKALNRIDIYRNTKNQFAVMKGLVSGT